MPSCPASYSTKGIGLVSDRNGVPVSASRRARRLERLAHGVAPRQRVAAVVDLVEDDERRARPPCAPGAAPACVATWA